MEECSICLSKLSLQDQICLLCDHTFHKMCLEKWRKQNKNTCPMCRRPFLTNELMIKYKKMGDLWLHYNNVCNTTENGNPLRYEALLEFVSCMNLVIDEARGSNM
jgi:hypothetical protein